MTYKVLLHPKVAKMLTKITDKTRIIDKLKLLKTDPNKAGKQLKPSKYYRTRIGNYRSIYEIDQPKNQVIILYIGHRKNIYDDFTKLL